MHPALGKAERQDDALFKPIQWIEQRKVSLPQKLQGMSRLAWQTNNEFKIYNSSMASCAAEFKLEILEWYYNK